MTGFVLVTGGAGYFGSLLVSRLVEAGQRVRIFDINEATQMPEGVEAVRGDIRDSAAVRRACEGVTVVHHNVAQVPLAKNAAQFRSVNEDGTRILLEAALDAGARKVVHMSSSAVYGAPKSNPVDETTPPSPGEAYGLAKLRAEEICAEMIRRGLDVTVLRPRTIMGHGRLGIMQILFEWVRQGKTIPVLGGGGNVYQFVHADDLASACLAAAARPGPSSYNIGAAEFGTMRETLEGLVRHAGTGSRIVSLPMAPAVALMDLTSRFGFSPLGAYHSLMYGRAMWFDISRARDELGYAPRHGNVAMFCESYDWYLAHRDEVLSRSGGSAHTSAVEQRGLRYLHWLLRLLPSV